MPTVYYLQWDVDDYGEANERFHQYHFDPPESLASSDFEQLYREVAEVDTYELEELYAEWNRGSGRESDTFLKQGVRSMSVGDIVEQEDDYYLCCSVGWDEIEIQPDG